MREDIDSLIEEILYGARDEEMAEAERQSEWKEALLGVADSEKPLRDDNFVDPANLLVWHEDEERLRVVPLYELPHRYPFGADGRWQVRDFGEILRLKFEGYRQSVAANELAVEQPGGNYECSTVVLFVPKDTDKPYSYIDLKAWARPR
jgi:hypothetical protein